MSENTTIEKSPVQDRTAIEAAQHTLVNSAISVALDMAYEQAAVEGKPIRNRYGKTKEETLEALKQIPDDRARTYAYNRLIKPGSGNYFAFDLSLKSSGAKSSERIQAKVLETQKSVESISDIVRLIAVSGSPSLIDDYASRLQKEVAKLPAGPKNHALKPHMEEWFARDNALLSKVLKTSINALGAEVQFLPRQQARLAARASHHYYTTIRRLNGPTSTISPEDVQSFVKEYNSIVDWINGATSKAELTDKDREDANARFATNDSSNVTFDEVSEGGWDKREGTDAPPKGEDGTLHYSPIMKTLDDFKTYIESVKALGKRDDVRLFPMTRLPETASMRELMAAQRKLVTLTQITHACYLTDAPENMRELWATKVTEVNRLAAESGRNNVIPQSIIDSVPNKVGPQLGGYRGK